MKVAAAVRSFSSKSECSGMSNVGKLTSFLLPLSESTLSMTCRLGTQFLHVSFQPCIDGKEEDWVQSIGRERVGRGG